MSQHPCAHGLSQVPMAVPPVPRRTTAPCREHSPGSWPVLSPGIPRGKEEQGEREVLTRAARDIAGLGLQLGALAGFPSAPRGHAPPRPGPGPSPAGHRAQAPRGPLFPCAVNCNTAQCRCHTLPALAGLQPPPPPGTEGSCPSQTPRALGWGSRQSRGRSPAPLCILLAPSAPPSHLSPNPQGP